MTDPLRSDRPAAPADPQERDRDARVEQLLLAGLDHYFAGQHERAISVWTRVLFLNHGHARARAYMERARSAIAERQRESEELLHTGVEAFARGDTADARRLLTSGGRARRGDRRSAGAARSAESPRAVRCRRQRRAGARSRASLRRRRPGAAAGSRPAAVARALGRRGRGGRRAHRRRGARGCGYRGADVWLVAGATTARPRRAPGRRAAAGAGGVRSGAGPRARRCRPRARLHEALARSTRVPHGDPLWAEAQTLRAAIQRQLLPGVGAPLTRPTARCGAGRRGHEVPQVPLHQLRRRRSLPQLRLRLLAVRSRWHPLDLPIRPDDTAGPMADLRLSVQRRRSAAAALTPPGADPTPRSAQPTPARRGRIRQPDAWAFDLPLFNDASRRRAAGQRQHAAAAAAVASGAPRRHAAAAHRRTAAA